MKKLKEEITNTVRFFITSNLQILHALQLIAPNIGVTWPFSQGKHRGMASSGA
jgi:hypothetical protein